MNKTTRIYSFDLSNFEAGEFVATRHPANRAVGGDWVCAADSDEEAIALAHVAAEEEWCAPEGRHHHSFTVTFIDA